MQLRVAAVAVEKLLPDVCHVLTKQLSCHSAEQIFVKGDCAPSTGISAGVGGGNTKVNRRGMGKGAHVSWRPFKDEGQGQGGQVLSVQHVGRGP